MTDGDLIPRLRAVLGGGTWGSPAVRLCHAAADALEAAKRENDRLRAHVVANCHWCRGTGISGGSGGTGKAQVTLWKCYHGMPEIFAQQAKEEPK